MRIKKAFTLIELLVVIAIIALLLSIVIPSVAKAKDYAKRTICMNGLRQTGLTLRLYVEDNNGSVIPFYNVGTDKEAATISALPKSTGGDYAIAGMAEKLLALGDKMPQPHNSYKVYFGGKRRTDGSFKPYHLGVLYDQGYVDVPKIFYCPAQPRNTAGYRIPYYYDFYVGQGNPSDYNSDADIGNYEWGTKCPADTRGGTGFVRTSFNYWVYGQSKFNRIDGYRPVIFDNIQEWEVVPHRKSHGVDSIPQGLSALFADGHVSFCNNEEIFEDGPNGPWERNITGDEGTGPGNDIKDFLTVLSRMNGN